jgi:hypothetical protein
MAIKSVQQTLIFLAVATVFENGLHPPNKLNEKIARKNSGNVAVPLVFFHLTLKLLTSLSFSTKD